MYVAPNDLTGQFVDPAIYNPDGAGGGPTGILTVLPDTGANGDLINPPVDVYTPIIPPPVPDIEQPLSNAVTLDIKTITDNLGLWVAIAGAVYAMTSEGKGTKYNKHAIIIGGLGLVYWVYQKKKNETVTPVLITPVQ